MSGEASAKAEGSAFDYQQVAFDLKERETPMADILSNIGSALRPVAKEMIKGGMYLFDSLSEVALEAGEHFKDLVAEAKADLAQQNGKPPAERAEEVVEKDDRKDRREPKRRVHVRRSR